MGGETIQQYKVGILDDDDRYMINLMNHINSDRDNPLFALAFSTFDELEAYMGAKELDLLVVAEELAEQVVGKLNIDKYIMLTRTRIYADQKMENDKVFRYSKVKDIISVILRHVNADDPGRRRQLFRSYGVISPIGRCGKTNLAISICMSDEVRGGLYIGMDEYSSFQDKEDVISNVIYLSKQHSSDLIPYMEQKAVDLGGYSVLGYLRSYMDAMELEEQDMRWMIEQIREWGRYTTVVYDIGQAVLKDINILGTFDELIVPVLTDELSQDKLGTFEEMMKRAELGKVVCRMKKVVVPDVPPGSADMMRFLEKDIERRT